MASSKSINTSHRVINAVKLLGSVQVASLVFTVLRTKCLALWLGSAGVGLFGLYNQAIEMLSQLSQLNIRESGVRAIVNGRMSESVIGLVGSLSNLLGFAGALLTLMLAPLLCRMTFGEDGHAWPFVVLSVVIFLRVLIAGRQAILQATERLRFMATAALWGNLVGTGVSIVLFRTLGMDGILPSLVVYTVVTAAAYYFRSSGIKSSRHQSLRATMMEGAPILRLGGYMTAAMFFTAFASYLFLVWLRSTSSDEGVGLYQAGYTVISQYVGIIFSAISVEFYPRITGVAASPVRTATFVAHEVSMLQWALLGCVVVFMPLAPVAVRILYSSTFAPVSTYIIIAAVGTGLRAYSVAIAYVILAKGDGPLYLLTEGISAVLYLGLNIVGYTMWGLPGAACAYIVWYLAYAVSVTIVYRCRYRLKLSRRVLWLTSVMTIIVAAQALLCVVECYLAATIVCVVVSVVSFTAFYKSFLKRRTVKE